MGKKGRNFDSVFVWMDGDDKIWRQREIWNQWFSCVDKGLVFDSKNHSDSSLWISVTNVSLHYGKTLLTFLCSSEFNVLKINRTYYLLGGKSIISKMIFLKSYLYDSTPYKQF